jgi:predicted double-glycine peptidase
MIPFLIKEIYMTHFLFILLSTILLSEEELRFTPIYKQGYDTSCGIAVTATLLNMYWNTPVTEANLYQKMILEKTGGETEHYTVSLLDISRTLGGYTVLARPYSMDWHTLEDTLEKAYAPIVIHYERPVPHFAVLLHIEKDFAFVADPARGFGLVHKSVFIKNYSGNTLLTASREAVKNDTAIKATVSAGQDKLCRLETLSRIRRLR